MRSLSSLLSSLWARRLDPYFWTVGGPRYVSRELLKKIYHITPHNLEENVLSKDWDVLIILDACRVDSLNHISSEFEWLPSRVNSIWSVGSTSREWMSNTFTESNDASSVTYITGNPYTNDYVTANQFQELLEVWKYYWDDEIGTIPARPITDYAVDFARKNDPNRLIIHYMQPHLPSVPSPLSSGVSIDEFGSKGMGTWNRLREGDIDKNIVKQAYLKNLRYIVSELALLRKNIDAERMIITADHGNAFGEWGRYAHPIGSPLPVIRKVPWAEISAEDTKTHTPDVSGGLSEIDNTVESRLEDLGYK